MCRLHHSNIESIYLYRDLFSRRPMLLKFILSFWWFTKMIFPFSQSILGYITKIILKVGIMEYWTQGRFLWLLITNAKPHSQWFLISIILVGWPRLYFLYLRFPHSTLIEWSILNNIHRITSQNYFWLDDPYDFNWIINMEY